MDIVSGLKRLIPALILLTLAGAGAGRPTLPRSPAASGAEAALLAFYSGPLNHLAGVRRGPCPMYPSCSEYSRQALKKHGFPMGWIMACDRLMRCSRDELHLAPAIAVRGTLKCHDPVAENDIWWLDTADRPDDTLNFDPSPVEE